MCRHYLNTVSAEATRTPHRLRFLPALFLHLSFCCALAVSALAEPKVYSVQKNDTVSSIAKKFGLSAQDLVAFNHLKNPDSLKPGETLKIPPEGGVAGTYRVQKGDTLGGIAQQHGVPVSELAAVNKLATPDQIVPGQELLIPNVVARAPAGDAPGLNPDLKRQLEKIRIVPGKWKYIVVHHSATAKGSAKGMDDYHRRKRRMVNGLAYHFVVGNGNGMPMGQIEIGKRWRRQIKGGHLASESLNEKCIGICLVGNFEKTKPPKAEMDALVALTRYLQARCGISSSKVKTHRKINTKPTQCPGRHFPEAEFLARL